MENEILFTRYTVKSWFKSAILGFLIGLGIIVPGVSGAQIAILFKLYDKLTLAISNILKKFKLCLIFLLPIGIGAVIGFGLGFIAVKELLAISTFCVIALFAGLMLGGTPVMFKEVKGSKITPLRIVLLVIGLAIPITVSAIACNVNVDLNTYLLDPTCWWMYVIMLPVGFVVAITQLIPGLSATSTLLSIGLYNPIVNSVSWSGWTGGTWHVFAHYALLIIGFVIGLFVLSKVITYVINKAKVTFYYLAIGLCFSSIAAMFYNPEVVDAYSKWATNNNMTIELAIGIPLFFIGAAIIGTLYFISEKKSKNAAEPQ